ncbi:hypothetical protein BH20BAC1_BH20BAC1_07830 [soil metagenome]
MSPAAFTVIGELSTNTVNLKMYRKLNYMARKNL